MWSSENCSEFQLKNLVQANVNVLVPFIYFHPRFMDLCQKVLKGYITHRVYANLMLILNIYRYSIASIISPKSL